MWLEVHLQGQIHNMYIYIYMVNAPTNQGRVGTIAGALVVCCYCLVANLGINLSQAIKMGFA